MGSLKLGLRLNKNYVTLMIDIPDAKKQTNGTVLGIDIGQNSIISCSNGIQSAPDPHGHTMKSICDRLARKKKGSKAFERTQSHRKNYVNYSKYNIDDKYFIDFMNKSLNNLQLDEIDCNATFLFSGYYQHDSIYTKYKYEIINFIINNPDLIIKTDKNDEFKIINFINYKINKTYKIVVHLRLEDFIEISQVINPHSVKK
jgi:hypothetical protein